MSRRKQSNPKPLKREDEEWNNEGDTTHTKLEISGEMSPRPESGHSSSASQPRTPTPAGQATTPPVNSPPRLRLKANLATDPALMPSAAPPIKPDPSPEPPHPSPRDYLSVLPPALSSAIAAGLFPVAGRPEAPPAYMCTPCGIRFSSPSTLEAHRTYYCSHRPGKQSADGEERGEDASADDASESSAKAIRTGKQYACTQCSYSADKKVSLNRHMRMHAASPGPPAVPPTPTPAVVHTNGDVGTESPALVRDRYCADCDIRFNSTKTFHAHKTHYCSTRQVVKQNPQPIRTSSRTSDSVSPSPNDSRKSPPSPTDIQRSLLALPTNPILIVPFSLIREARVWHSASVAGMPNPDTPCFLLPNGTLQPMSPAFAQTNFENKETEVLKSANRPREVQPPRDITTPLDLTIRKSPVSSMGHGESDDHEKENRSRRSQTPEQIVCAPSLPVSPVTSERSPRLSSSPSIDDSPRLRRRESRGPTPRSASIERSPEAKFPGSHELAARLSADGATLVASPQVLVKQGVSKCKECNIVFCKYENYLAHKTHYCAKRGSNEEEAEETNAGGRVTQYQQFICVTCGIKFSTLDSLTTHQTFYCNKPGERGRGTSAEGGGWRCPCCDVVSATAAAAQRHMDTHSGVKAFQCTLCQYKGNTLRGMRTHIRMHFAKSKPADFHEESFISCIGDEESSGASSPNSIGAGERVHRCSLCAYTSTYRGNVIRHARLVHALADTPHSRIVHTNSETAITPPNAPSTPAPPAEVKREPDDVPTENYCKSCDISFKYLNSFKAHKEFYCTSHANNSETASPNNNVTHAAETPAL